MIDAFLCAELNPVTYVPERGLAVNMPRGKVSPQTVLLQNPYHGLQSLVWPKEGRLSVVACMCSCRMDKRR